MKKLLIPLLSLAAGLMYGEVLSDTIGLVQFASESSIESRGRDAVPGQLLATEYMDSGSNVFVALTIGSPLGARLPVSDKHALRRTPISYLDYPNFYIELGPNQKLIDDHTVQPFYNYVEAAISPQNPEDSSIVYTQTFKIVPQNDFYLLDATVVLDSFSMVPGPAMVTWSQPDIAVTELNGTLYVEVITRPWYEQTVWNVTVKIKSVKGVKSGFNTIRDDLTAADYFFTDDQGSISLGTLRTWIKNRYDNYRANFWANFPALGQVNLAGNTLRFSDRFKFNLSSLNSTNDNLTLWSSGHRGLTVITDIGNSSDGTTNVFRIFEMDMKSSDTFIYLYADIGFGEPYCISTTSLTDPEWTTPAGQVTERTVFDGVDCYCVAVPKSNSSTRFYRLVASGADGLQNDGAVYTQYAVYTPSINLRDANNKYWRLSVDTNGVLQTQGVEVPDPTIPTVE